MLYRAKGIEWDTNKETVKSLYLPTDYTLQSDVPVSNKIIKHRLEKIFRFHIRRIGEIKKLETTKPVKEYKVTFHGSFSLSIPVFASSLTEAKDKADIYGVDWKELMKIGIKSKIVKEV